jgi:AraC family transcriptional regulator, regulatory protein of adaptative response / DNA-3-methyladenine glycosylase II
MYIYSMIIDPKTCYQALCARDPRFDGRFFTAVRTTGIYCRPICPARTPKRSNVLFFTCAAAAEEAGFRPCRRCRPETAPGTPAWDGTSAIVSRAVRLISQGIFDDVDLEKLAESVGVGSRHLRRLFIQHIGVAPRAVVRTQRLHFARQLIDETDLSMTRIAFAAGFNSIRRFNQAILKSFRASPTELRHTARRDGYAGGALTMRLAYRPPLDWKSLLGFLHTRAIPGVESIENGAYQRSIEVDGKSGIIEVMPGEDGPYLAVRMKLPPTARLAQIIDRVRRVFDLSADPVRIADDLGGDPILGSAVRALPGLRLPGAWDPFELMVRAVLGQQISVKAASTIAGRIVQRFGRPIAAQSSSRITHVFPHAEVLRDADLRVIGLTAARARTVRDIATAECNGNLPHDSSLGLDSVIKSLTAIRGIGEWTAQYIAMRAFGEPDAFPDGDLGLRHAASNSGALISNAELKRMAERWRPWRAYAAMYLWGGLGLEKSSER